MKIRLATEADLLDPTTPLGAHLAETFGFHGNGAPGVEHAAAPVGSRYTDTAATGGARTWVKDPAGWRVVGGDTGWVQVAVDSAAGNNHPGVGVRVRRIDGVVHASVLETSNAVPGAGVTTLCTLGPGWAKDETTTVQVGSVVNLATGLAVDGRVLVTPQSQIKLVRAGAFMHGGSVSWPAPRVWPSA